jgi:hypothetical protein
VVTPLAITRSELETLPVLYAPRRVGRWTLVAAAASLSMVGGLGYLTRAEGRPRPDAASLLPSAPAVAPSPSPASEDAEPQAVDAPPPPAPVIQPVGLTPARHIAAALPYPRSQPQPKPRSQPPPAITRAAEKVQVPPTASAAAAPQQQGVIDAWDPKSFGGRR